VASATHVATARDGRTLTFAEWGDPAGVPVFSLHGTPGSRFSRHYDESKYAEAGARVITYDGRDMEGPSGTPVDASSTALTM
jgi:pimeloyl-ACP methyl ester carboxylesterase